MATALKVIEVKISFFKVFQTKDTKLKFLLVRVERSGEIKNCLILICRANKMNINLWETSLRFSFRGLPFYCYVLSNKWFTLFYL